MSKVNSKAKINDKIIKLTKYAKLNYIITKI